jgi:hypothetical protein
MATYLSLDEAAKKLGITTSVLIDLRSQGQVRGFRDGTSWKFPDSEIERLKEELPNLTGFGSGILAADGPGSKVGSVIGGDDSSVSLSDEGLDGDGSGGSGSSLDLGLEISTSGGDSDVNLIASDGSDLGSDVLVIPQATGGSGIGIGGSGMGRGSGSDLPIDLDNLNLADSAISHDSGELNLAAGATSSAGKTPAPSPSKPAPVASDDSDEFNLGSVLDLEADENAPVLDLGGEDPGSGASGSGAVGSGSSGEFSGLDLLDDDSDDIIPGSDADLDLGMVSNDENASSLEMMDDLDLTDSASSIGGIGSVSGDVLSELDLLAGDSVGSGLLSGDSENLLGSSLMSVDDGGSSGVDDALADDDDLIISDGDDDLIVSGAGSDISIAGDSGINLMSPSDSGLSLESEPLDLAGSSISALDLGAELIDGSGSGGGSSGYGSGLIPDDGSGSAVDFPADEEFQLSPSGIQLEASDESESQEIDIENSDSFGSGGFEDVPFEEAGVFEEEPVFEGVAAPVAAGGFDFDKSSEEPTFDAEEEAVAETPGGIETSTRSAAASLGAPAAYEVPFTIWQTVGLLLILMVMSLGGMLMTDLVRNMWTHTETAAPVSSLTDALIDVAGWGR